MKKLIDVTLDCPDDQFVLDTAEEAGIELPYSCRGACSTVQVKLQKEQQINQNNHLEDEQMEAGFCLTCVAYPSSDCTIIPHMEDELY